MLLSTSVPTRLTDLPCLPLTRIIEFIHTPVFPFPRSPPSSPPTLTLASDHSLFYPIPQVLLPVALSSPTLAAAVAALLRTEAVFLTANNTQFRFLPEWLIALSQHVKALSAWDREMETANLASTNPPPHLSDETKCVHTKRLLRCLRVSHIPLHVLDIADLPFHKIDTHRQQLTDDLIQIFDAAKHELRELSVPMDSIITDALACVALPRLQTLEVHLRNFNGEESGKVGSTCGVGQVLRAAENALRRSNGALKNLTLCQIEEVPFRELGEDGGMCQTVEVLRIDSSFYIADKGDSEMDALVDFVTLFSQLRSLSWDGDVTERRLNRIVSACPLLENITLNPVYIYTESQGADSLSEDERDVESLSRVFMACQGKLMTLKLKGSMSTEVWRMLGQNNPSIERIATQIGADNVAALVPFLGTFCRNVKEMEFRLDREEQNLGAYGWDMFRRAVESASEELQAIHVLNEMMKRPLENDIEQTINAIVAIFEAVGNRARGLSFAVPFGTRDFKPLAEGLVRIVRAAANFTKNLQSLYLDFTVADADYEWWGDEDSERDHWQELLIARRELRRGVPTLQSLHLSGLDEIASEYFAAIAERVE